MSKNANPKRAVETRESAALFAALGDETRLLLVSRLSQEGPLSIAALTVGSKVTRQGIAKHLRVMEAANLVRSTRRGRETICRLEQTRLDHAQNYLSLISKRWDESIERLRKFVEM